jgi:hypothetical protein
LKRKSWNYALEIDERCIEDSIGVEDSTVGERPFTAKQTPVRRSAKVRRLPEWQATDGTADPVPISPVATAQNEETVSLVPYAAAKLRVTAFPVLKSS